jgi:predicted nuclease of predicted toxin-antitoxin system
MKVLLDECVPWPLHKLLDAHQCTTAQRRGWGGFKNGDLIQLAEAEFDVFITSDQNIRYQQNLAGRRIAILKLSNNDLRRIQRAALDLRAASDCDSYALAKGTQKTRMPAVSTVTEIEAAITLLPVKDAEDLRE